MQERGQISDFIESIDVTPQIGAIYVSFPKKVFSSSFEVIKGKKLDNEVNNFNCIKKYNHRVHFCSFFQDINLCPRGLKNSDIFKSYRGGGFSVSAPKSDIGQVAPRRRNFRTSRNTPAPQPRSIN